jgi:hypothetical protein
MGGGVNVTVDIEDISLGNSYGAPERNGTRFITKASSGKHKVQATESPQSPGHRRNHRAA